MAERMLVKEYCVENIETINKAIDAGASRIELCADLSVGGITPQREVVLQAVAICSRRNVPVMVMARPRGGNFVYSESEVSEMQQAIYMSRDCGASGVVFGALTSEGEVDCSSVSALMSACSGLSTTFHMAFDHISPEKQLGAIDYISEIGFDRILTHGSAERSPIEENMRRLGEYIHYAAGRLSIMPGGCVTFQNVDVVASQLDIREAHGTSIVLL